MRIPPHNSYHNCDVKKSKVSFFNFYLLRENVSYLKNMVYTNSILKTYKRCINTNYKRSINTNKHSFSQDHILSFKKLFEYKTCMCIPLYIRRSSWEQLVNSLLKCIQNIKTRVLLTLTFVENMNRCLCNNWSNMGDCEKCAKQLKTHSIIRKNVEQDFLILAVVLYKSSLCVCWKLHGKICQHILSQFAHLIKFLNLKYNEK
jgi:hypothetical protein